MPEVFENKLAFMKVTSASNRRTIRASLVPKYPCGDSIPVIRHTEWELDDYHILSAVLNSYALDYVARTKIQGINANWYLIESFPYPDISGEQKSKLLDLVKRLHLPIPNISFEDGKISVANSDNEVVTDPCQRAQIREEIDEIIADLYGLSESDMEYILRSDNDDPRNLYKDYKERLKILGGESKWGELPEEDIEK